MCRRKHAVRAAFREAVFARERGRCAMCGRPAVDAHHITDRTRMPHGGYVAENGIALCAECHERAERFHARGTAAPGYAPADLYAKIGSSLAAAAAAAARSGE